MRISNKTISTTPLITPETIGKFILYKITDPTMQTIINHIAESLLKISKASFFKIFIFPLKFIIFNF